MKIFVGYGYNPRDAWIEELLLPLIEALECQPVTGTIAADGALSAAVLQKVKSSDAVIGMLTRRDKKDNDEWTTHAWVIQELAAAAALQMRLILEVREEGVPVQGGMQGDRQYVLFDESNKAECLVRIAQIIGSWKERRRHRVQLGPEEFVQQMLGVVDDAIVDCKWLDDRATQEEEFQGVLRGIKGGVFLLTDRLPATALIKVRVRAGAHTWVSAYEALEPVKIDLRRQV